MSTKIRFAVVSLLCVASLVAQQFLDNDAILKLVKAGLSEDVIIGMVNNQLGKYATSPDDVIHLKEVGVPDRIITAMVNKSSAVPSPTPTAAKLPANQRLVLHDGTPVKLRLSRNLSSADARTGDTIDFEVLEDVTVDDVLLIPRGGTAIGTVTRAEHKKRMARGGKLDVTIDYVRLVSGEKVALRAVKETSGGGHTGAMTGAIVATAIVVWPAAPFFLFMHGKDTTIPKGTEVTAYVNGEVKLDRFSGARNVEAGGSYGTNGHTEQPATQAVQSPPTRTPGLAPSTSGGANGGLVEVAFSSNPPGARVFFSGMAFSTTPFITKLQPGKYPIKMTLAGYADWTGEITVESGRSSKVVAQMEKR